MNSLRLSLLGFAGGFALRRLGFFPTGQVFPIGFLLPPPLALLLLLLLPPPSPRPPSTCLLVLRQPSVWQTVLRILAVGRLETLV